MNSDFGVKSEGDFNFFGVVRELRRRYRRFKDKALLLLNRGADMVSIYITSESKNGKRYRYIIIEDKKEGLKIRFRPEDVIHILLAWCGGWDLNPRRPTPREPESHSRFDQALAPSFDSGNPGDTALPLHSPKHLREFYKACVEHASEEQCKRYLHYLSKPLDPSNRWSTVSYKRYYRFLCNKGVKEACVLEKQVKVKKSGVDTYVPSEKEVLEALECEEPYRTAYLVLVQSGLRVTEAVYLLNHISELEVVDRGAFKRVHLGLERGAKKALWAYLVQIPPRVLITEKALSSYAKRQELVAPKYIRKWVATQMQLLGIPETAVDFIQGRVPDTILRKHYTERLAIADKAYPKYAQWLTQWLEKHGLLGG